MYSIPKQHLVSCSPYFEAIVVEVNSPVRISDMLEWLDHPPRCNTGCTVSLSFEVLVRWVQLSICAAAVEVKTCNDCGYTLTCF